MVNLFEKIRARYHPLHKLRSNSALYSFLSKIFDRKISCRPNGVTFPVRVRLLRHLPWILASKSLEPGVASLFIALKKTMDINCFFDVGANIGFYSWLLLSQDQNTKVFLFEPELDNGLLIEETIALGKLANAKLLPLVASNLTGTMKFAQDHLAGASGTTEVNEQTFLEIQHQAKSSIIDVESITLDDATQKCAVPDLVKIDVEGAEGKVIAGAHKLIAEHAPIFIIECNLNDRKEVADKLMSAGYMLFNADNATPYNIRDLNILAVPPSKKDQIADLFSVWQEEMTKWKQ